MVDYERLAAQAKATRDAASSASRKAEESAVDPKVYFQKVASYLAEEMSKANAELAKRGVDTISRNHLPGFEGVIFLAFGVGYLCRVELDAQPKVSRIKAILSGPPNRQEISRREFSFGQEPSPPGSPHAEMAPMRFAGPTPQQVAQEIIEGIVVGNFE